MRSRLQQASKRAMGCYVFMVVSVLPFLLAPLNLGWALFIFIPVVATSLLHPCKTRALLIDLGGAFAFGLVVVVSHFPEFPFHKSLLLFSNNTANVYFSLFWAYLAVQPILKFSLVKGLIPGSSRFLQRVL